MASFRTRISLWADWLGAFAVGIVALNLNVTSDGDPLRAMDETARSLFYAALAVGALVLTAAGLMSITRTPSSSRLLLTTYPLVALSGVLGLLLDYRDGPVRTVQLAVYVLLGLGIIRMARVVALALQTDAAPTGTADEHSRSMSESG